MEPTPDTPMTYRETLEQRLKKYRWLQTRMATDKSTKVVQKWIVELEGEIAKCAGR